MHFKRRPKYEGLSRPKALYNGRMILTRACWASAKPYSVILEIFPEYLLNARDSEAATLHTYKGGGAPALVFYRPWAPGSVGYDRDKASKGHTLLT